MSDTSPFAFGKLVPGFDFLQKLAQTPAAGGAPGLGHWIAPTVNVQELEQRISELRTVQFWLEQNLLAVRATVQALEVQKMTLQTLRGMNLNLGEVAQAFAAPGTSGKAAAPGAAPAGEPGGGSGPTPEGQGTAAAERESRQPVADPMQWWGALTRQFQQIALQALEDTAAYAVPPEAARPSPAAKRAASAAKKGKPGTARQGGSGRAARAATNRGKGTRKPA